MLKKFLFLLLLVFVVNLSAQELDSESYFPLKNGMSKTLTWYKSKYREVIKDTIKVNGKTYTQVSQIFPPKKEINIYLRKSNDTIFFFNETTKTEKAFFSIAEEKDKQVGAGTVIKTNAKLRTPKGKLSELLVIEMKYSNGSKDTRFYKKGIGLVAVKNNKGLICHYVPD